MQKILECFEVNEWTFNAILETFSDDVVVEYDLDKYYKGWQPRNRIFFDGWRTILCRECDLAYCVKGMQCDNNWKQCIVTLNPSPKSAVVERSIDGTRAWARMMFLLSNFYTKEEISERLNMFQADYKEELKQVHYYIEIEPFTIYKFTDCVKYDINGAHNDALCEIFPKAAKLLKKHYNERHEKPINKKEVNYFVGMLKRKGYAKTYNWIVQRTTKILYECIDKCYDVNDARNALIYANTDCCVVCHPVKTIPTSHLLGDFKLEYEGDVYLYKDKNYILMECGNDHTGNCLYMVRDRISLKDHKVVQYDLVKEGLTCKAINQKEVIINASETI